MLVWCDQREVSQIPPDTGFCSPLLVPEAHPEIQTHSHHWLWCGPGNSRPSAL